MTEQTPIHVQPQEEEQQISAEQLRTTAHAVVSNWHVTHLPQGKGGFTRRIEATRDALDILYTELEEYKSDPAVIADPFLELRENPRLLRAVVLESYSIRRKLQHLPRIVLDADQDEPRVAALAGAYLDAAHSKWSPEALQAFLGEAQKSDPLELEELWALPTMLKFMLLEWILAQADARLHAPDSAAAGAPEILRTRIKA